MEDVHKYAELIANLVTIGGVAAIAVWYVSHVRQLHQFQFQVMVSCITRFQELLKSKKLEDWGEDELRSFIDLSNEELFYFQRDYIPKEVVIEWMDSMIDMLVIHPNNKNHTSKKLIKGDYLKNYPRVKKAFKISYEPDFISKSGRINLIKKVGENLNIKISHKLASKIVSGVD